MLKTASSVINALGALVYQGTWDANANSPTLTSSVGTKGSYYVVSVAGTTTLNGISTWSVGDWAVFNGSVWQKVDGGTSESFINLTVTGTANIATGNVVNMTSSNVTITGGTENAVTYTNVTISSGNVTVTNDNVAYSNISTALRTQALTGYLYGNANTGNVTAATTIPVASVTGAVPNTVNVLVSSPITGGGALTGNVTVSIQQANATQSGYLSSTDWSTFNNKQPSGTYVTSVTGTAPVVSSGGTTPAISMAAATSSVNGYLTSTDWSTFNGKQAALVSGTNIKTVNNTSLLGSGDVGTIGIGYGGTGQTSFTAGQIHFGSFSTSANLFWDNTNNRLGVGTSSPNRILEVSGTTGISRLTSSTGTNAVYREFNNTSGVNLIGNEGSSGGNLFIGSSAYAMVLGTVGAYPLQLAANNSVRMTVFSSGGVSIGNSTDPGATNLSVTGTASSVGSYNSTTASAANVNIASSGLFARSTSALKYKQEIRDLESIDINKFRPVRYKSKCINDDQTIDHFGFIADEVDAAGIKELVTYNPDGQIEGFQYERLTVVLLKSIQDLKLELKSIQNVLKSANILGSSQ